jgi:autotransporter-associated beta strand protein
VITAGGTIDGTLIKDGSGTLILSGTNAFAGATQINSGTLQIGEDGVTTSIATSNIANNGTLAFAGSSNLTYNGVISGSGALTKSGTGTLTLSGANTYTGGTTINAGTLALSGGDNRLATNGNVTIAGGTLDLGGHSQGISGLLSFQDVSGGILQHGTMTLTPANATAFTTVSVTQSATINADLVLLSAQNWNVASGQTLSIAGNIDFTVGSLYLQGPGTTIFNGSEYNGAVLVVSRNGTATFNSGSLTLSAYLFIGFGNNGDTNGTFNWNSTGELNAPYFAFGTFGGVGIFTQTAGTAFASSGFFLGSIGGTYNLNGGTFETAEISGPQTPANIPTGCVVNFGGGTLKAMGNISPGNGLSYAIGVGKTATIDTNGYDVSLGGTISGSGTLTKTGTGTLTLSSANTYTGGTAIRNGTLKLGVTNALPTTTTVTFGTSTTNGVLELNGFNQQVSGLAVADGATAASQIIGNSSTTVDAALTLDVTNAASVFAGTIRDTVTGVGGHKTSLVVTSADATYGLYLGGANTYSGGTTIGDGENSGAGCVAALGTSAFGVGVINLAGGLLAGNTTLSNAISVVASIPSFIVTSTDYVLTLNGSLSGTGAIGYLSGGGSLTLGGNNHNFSGLFEQFGTNNAVTYFTSANAGSALASWTIDNGAFANRLSDTATIAFGSISGSGILRSDAVSGTVTYFIGSNNQSTTFSGTIINGASGGTVALTKSGTGTLTLSGNNTYTGATTVNGGVLSLGSTGSLTSNTTVASGGELDMAAGAKITGNLSVASGGTMNFNGGGWVTGNATLAGSVIASSGSIEVDGTLTLAGGVNATTNLTSGITLTTGNLLIQRTVVLNGGTLNLTGHTMTVDLTNGGSSTANSGKIKNLGAISVITAGGTIDGTLIKDGSGTLILSGTNAFAGATQINSGTLQIGEDGVTTSIATSNITNNGTLVFAGSSNLVYNGVISGGGDITKSGTGALTLGGANTYVGVTTVKDGALLLGNSTALGETANSLHVDGVSALLDLVGYSPILDTLVLSNGVISDSAVKKGRLVASNLYVLEGAISAKLDGSGQLTKLSTNSVTLSGANSYTGLTTVTNGSLILGLSAQPLVLGGSGTTDLRGGRIVFDYTGGVTPAATILSLLTASYGTAAGPHFTSGQIFCSTATSSLGLGWADNAPNTNQVIIARTLYGDANLDGIVSISEVRLSQSHIGPNTAWSLGNYDYSGATNVTDALIAAYNCNHSVPQPTMSLDGDSEVNSGSMYTLTLGTVAGVSNPSYVIDWGDGTEDSTYTSETLPPNRNVSHSYANGFGLYAITIDLIDASTICPGVATKVVEVTKGVPTLPTALPDSYVIRHDKELCVDAENGVLANDIRRDGTLLHAIILETTQNGTLNLSNDGSFIYIPDSGFVGIDTFTYGITEDPSSSPVTVQIVVEAQQPHANDDHYYAITNRPLTVPKESGLLANDTAAISAGDRIEIVDNVQHGVVSWSNDGAFTYTPDSSYVGKDTFRYRIEDGAIVSNIATVTFDVSNQSVCASGNEYSTYHDQKLIVSVADGVLANDWSQSSLPLTAIIDTVNHGAVVLQDNGAFEFTPETGFVGVAGFTYHVTDGFNASEPVAVTIYVQNHSAVAAFDNYRVHAGKTLTASALEGVLANDSRDPGENLVATLVGSSSYDTISHNSDGSFTKETGNGQFTLWGDGRFVYVGRKADWAGDETFYYTVSDGITTSTIATIKVTTYNNSPIAADDSYLVRQGECLTVTTSNGILANDSDPDGDSINTPAQDFWSSLQTIKDNVDHGTLSLNKDGSFTYQPNANYVGEDSFTYVCTEESGGRLCSNKATVRILVVSNNSPSAMEDHYTVQHGCTLQVGADDSVLANDFDSDSDILTATVDNANTVKNGILDFHSDGSFSYTPNRSFVGTDYFTYKVSDGIALGEPVTVAIDVWGDAPLAISDSYIAHGGPLAVTSSNGILANDSDLNGDVLAPSLVSDVSHGSLSRNLINGVWDGGFVYTPNAGFIGTDSFTYRLSDGAQESDSVAVVITVSNTAPIAYSDSYSVAHDCVLTVTATNGVLTNDLDLDNDPMVASWSSSVNTSVQHGTLEFHSDGSFVYTPVAGYVGNDSFSYQVTDGVSVVGDAVVSLRVTNETPFAVSDAYEIKHGSTLTVSAQQGVGGNDNGCDDDSLSYCLVGGPSNGTLIWNSDGSFVYSPNAGFAGSDTFSYRVSDGAVLSEIAHVAIEVTNTSPIVYSGTYGVTQGQTLSVSGSDGLLVGNTDADPLTWTITQSPVHGTVAIDADGGFSYTPTLGYAGFDTVGYEASDGITQSSGTITVAVKSTTPTLGGQNGSPLGVMDIFHVRHDHNLSVNSSTGVLANDYDAQGDSLAASLVTGPTHASSFALNEDGSFVYTPNSSFAGTDTFTYQVNDGQHTTGPIMVVIDVQNCAPNIRSDSFAVHAGQQASVNVFANDSDNDGDGLAATVVNDVQHGTLTIVGNGVFTYTPVAGFVGYDSFTYCVSDGVATTSPTRVTINVQNRTPSTNDDSYRLHHDATLNATGLQSVLANDWDGDGDSLTASLVADTAHGDLTFNADGSFVYTPDTGYVGLDQFTYHIHDGSQYGRTATVTIDVWNNVPTGHENTYAVDYQKILSVSLGKDGVLSDDYDWDGDAVFASLATNVSHGTLAFSSNGTFTYTPFSNFAGTDSFTYRLYDGTQYSSPIAVTINVRDNAPLALDDYFAFHHTASSFSGNVIAGTNGDADSDPDGNSFTATLINGPATGSLTFSSAGDFTYTPPAGSSAWTGTVSFTYQLTDGAMKSRIATATIEIDDTEPIACEDAFYAVHGTTVSGNLISGDAKGAGKDYDADSDDLKIDLGAFLGKNPNSWTEKTTTNGTATYESEDGTLSLSTTGSFTFTPKNGGIEKTISFVYTITDGAKSSSTKVTIDYYNNAPVGMSDIIYVTGSDPVTIDIATLTANDHDPDGNDKAAFANSIKIDELPTQGTLQTADGQAVKVGDVITSSLKFIPPSSLTSSFSFADFKYTVSDGFKTSDSTLVLLTMGSTTTVLNNDTCDCWAGQSVTIDVLANDWTNGTNPLTVTEVRNTSGNGTVVINSNGTLTYTPRSRFDGTADSFDYYVDATHKATVTVNVIKMSPVNDTYTIVHDRVLTINYGFASVLGNDAYYTQNTPRVELVSQATSGNVKLNPDGTFLYTPSYGYIGAATFTYKLTNGSEESSTGTVTINVTNQAPTAENCSCSVDTNQILSRNRGYGGAFQIGDPDGDPLEVKLDSPASTTAGVMELQTDGSFVFTPNSGFIGQAYYTYHVTDGIADSETKTLTINVNGTTSTPPPVYVSELSYTVAHTGSLDVDIGNGLLHTLYRRLTENSDPESCLRWAGTEAKAVLVSGPASGSTLTLNDDGSFVYTPNGTLSYGTSRTASDTFRFKVVDANNNVLNDGNDHQGIVASIAVTNVLIDSPWRAMPRDNFEVYWDRQGTPPTIQGDVSSDLSSDLDGDPISVSLVTPCDGLTWNADGTFTYNCRSSVSGDYFVIRYGDGLSYETCRIHVGYTDPPTRHDGNGELNGGAKWENGGVTVENPAYGSPIHITRNGDGSVTLSAVNPADTHRVFVTNANVRWEGNATGGLNLWVYDGSVLGSISITGDLYVNAIDGDVGNLTGKSIWVEAKGNVGNLESTAGSITAYADNVGNISAAGDVNVNTGYLAGNDWAASSKMKTVGNITTGGNLSVAAATIGNIQGQPTIGQLTVYQLDSDVSAASIRQLTCTTKIEKSISVTGNIDGIQAYGGISGNVSANSIGSIVVGSCSIDYPYGRTSAADVAESCTISVKDTLSQLEIYGNLAGAIKVGSIKNLFVHNSIVASGILESGIQGTGGGASCITVDLDIKGSITVKGHIGSSCQPDYCYHFKGVRVGRDFTGSLTANSVGTFLIERDFKGTVVVGNANSGINLTVQRDFCGAMTVTGYSISTTIGRDLVASGSLTIVNTTGYVTIVVKNNFLGTVDATSINSLTIANDLEKAGRVTVDNGISTIAVGHDYLGTITAGSGGGVTVQHDFSGILDINGTTLSHLSIGRDFTGTGMLNTGTICDQVVVGRDFSGTITAGTDINAVDIHRDFLGNISAAANSGQIRVRRNFTSNGRVTAKRIGGVGIGGDFTGTIAATDGDVGEVGSVHNISGTITATGNIGRVFAGRNWSGEPTWGICLEIAGGSQQGGSIDAARIEADGNIGKVEAAAFAGVGGSISGNTTIISTSGSIGTVQADNGIDATISAYQDIAYIPSNIYPWDTQVSTAHGDISGSITAQTGSIRNRIVAQWGSIEADIHARTSVGEVTARDDISGDIISDTSSIAQITTTCGSINGNIIAATDIGKISAGKNIGNGGKIITAGGNIGDVNNPLNPQSTGITAGMAGGGNVGSSICANGVINYVVALGPWTNISSTTSTTAVYDSGNATVAGTFASGSTKVELATAKKPSAIPYGCGNYGNIAGEIRATSIRRVTAYGNITGNITATQKTSQDPNNPPPKTLGNIWALGAIGGNVTANLGSLNINAWKGISGKVTAENGDIIVKAYGKISGTVESKTGTVSVSSWESVLSSSVKAESDITIWAFDGSLADDVVSACGSVTNIGLQSVKAKNVKSALSCIITGAAVTLTDIAFGPGAAIFGWNSLFVDGISSPAIDLPFTGKTWLVSFGDVTANNVSGSVRHSDIQIAAWGKVNASKITGNSLQIDAYGSVTTTNVNISDTVTIDAQSFSGTIGTGEVPKAVSINARGDIGNGDTQITAKNAIALVSLGNVYGRYTTTADESVVAINAYGDVGATVSAKKDIIVTSWGNISSGALETATGSIVVEADKGVAGGVRIDAGAGASVHSFGDVAGIVNAENGDVNIFTAKDMKATIKATGKVGIEAWHDFSGSVEAGAKKSNGSSDSSAVAQIIAHGNIVSREIISAGNVEATAFGNLQNTAVTGTAGSVAINAIGNISNATITAGTNATVSTWTSLTSSKINATGGDAEVSGYNSINGDVTVSAKRNASLSSKGDIKATVTTTEGDASLTTLGNITSGTMVTAAKGNISAYAKGDVNLTATAWTQGATGSASAQDVAVFAKGKVNGTYTARTSIEIVGLDAIDVTAESKDGTIQVSSKGTLAGSYLAKGSISASSFDALSGNYESTDGDVAITSLDSVNGQTVVKAGTASQAANGSADVVAANDVGGTITAKKDVSVVAGQNVSAAVTAGANASIAAANGNVTGAIQATSGSASVTALGNVTNTIAAGVNSNGSINSNITTNDAITSNVTVLAKGNVDGAIKAADNASVVVFGNLSKSITAGQDASAFVKGELSQDAAISAGRDASLTSLTSVVNAVDAGRNASVLTLVSVTGNVTAAKTDAAGVAAVSAKTDVTGNVTASLGSATVLAGNQITGNVTAKIDASVLAIDKILGDISAEHDADVTTWTELDGAVSAGRDATVWTSGKVSEAISAGRDATVVAKGDIEKAVTANGTATVTTYGSILANVTAGIADILALDDITANILARTGKATVRCVDNLSGNVTATEQDADVAVFGNLTGNVTAKTVASVVVGKSTTSTITAGDSASLSSEGTVNATVNAGSGNASVLSLSNDAAVVHITAGNDASVSAGGNLSGSIDAGHDAFAFGIGNVTETITSVRNATVTALGNVAADSITAGGSATVLALGQVSGSISGQAGVSVWGYGNLTALSLESDLGGVSAITDGVASFTDVSAGGDVSLVALSINQSGGGMAITTLTAGGNVNLFSAGSLGVTGQLTATGNLSAATGGSDNSLLLQLFTVGDDAAILSTGDLTATGSVGGDASLVSYAGLNGNVSVGDDIVQLASLGNLNGTFSAADNIDDVICYGSFTGNLSTGATQRANDDVADGWGNIRRVRIWDDATSGSSISAGTAIGEVYAGGELQGTISAPTVGTLAEGNRTKFIDRPTLPIFPTDDLRAMTVDAYCALSDIAQGFAASKTEISEMQEATLNGIGRTLLQTNQRLIEMKAEASDRVADIGKQVTLASTSATQEADWAFRQAGVALDSAARIAKNGMKQLAARAERAFKATEGQLTTGRHSIEQQVMFLQAKRDQVLAYRTQDRTAASLKRAWLVSQQAQDAAFSALFYSRIKEFVVEGVQEFGREMELVGTAVSFVNPILGSQMIAIGGLASGSVNIYRGKYLGGIIEIGLTAVPYLSGMAFAGSPSLLAALAQSNRSFLQGMMMRHTRTYMLFEYGFITGIVYSLMSDSENVKTYTAAGAVGTFETGAVASKLFRERLIPRWLYKTGRTTGYFGTAALSGFTLGQLVGDSIKTFVLE